MWTLGVRGQGGDLLARGNISKLAEDREELPRRDGSIQRQMTLARTCLVQLQHGVPLESEARRHPLNQPIVIAGDDSEVITRLIGHPVG